MMNILLAMLLVSAPAMAADDRSGAEAVPVSIGVEVGDFEEEVESISEKLRRLIASSRRERYLWEINHSLAERDTDKAQKALDAMSSEFPELKEREPNAFKYHQGGIYFWSGRLDAAYSEFDAAAKALERKYPNGIPSGPFFKKNSSFMSRMYFSRGATDLHRKRYAQAADDIDRAIRMSPEPKAYMQVNKCWALIGLKRYKEAAEAYDRAYMTDGAFTRRSESSYPVCPQFAKNGAVSSVCRADN